MIDLGTVRPGSTIRIPFSSFDKDDGSSITMTNYAAADILIYKDGSTTERASTAGFTATTDFDTKTGKHLAVIDLSDNTTAGFYAAGSEYLVAIDAVTVDTVTTGGWIARFRIGYPGAVLDTTIATLTTQTSFTLTAGPAEDDALTGMWAVIHDAASAVQCSWVQISDYVGASKTVTLAAGATFTAAASDNISVMFPVPLQPTVLGRTADVTATGAVGIDWANVENPTTVVDLSGTTIKTTQKVDVETIKTNPVVNGGTVTFPTNATLASTTNITAGTVTTATNVTTVNGLAAGVITAAAIATDAIDADALAADAIAEINATVDTALADIFLDKLVSASGTSDSGTTTTMVDAARTEADADYWKGSIIKFTSGNISGQCAIITDFNAGTDTITFAPATTQAVSTQTYVILPGVSVWDDTLAEHLASGTTGNALNAAGSAGDPWATALPGAYGAGTAGHIVGTAIPDVAGGAAGGLLIAGSNAATTFASVTVSGATTLTGNVSMAAGLNITQSSSNASALVVTGNGTGHGAIITSGSGITGNGLHLAAASTNGNALYAIGSGTGDGFHGESSGSGRGIHAASGLTCTGTIVVTGTTTLAALSCTSLSNSGATTLTGIVTATNASNDIRGITVAATGLAGVTTWTVAITGNITGNLSGSVGSVTGAVGSVTGNVGGNVTGSVGSVLGGINTTAGVITTLDGLDTAQDAQHATTQAKTNLLPEGPAKNTSFTYPIKMVDSTDHVTPKTGLTVTMTRSLDGAAFSAATGTVTEISSGHYKVVASAADMNGDVVAHRFAGTAADDYTVIIQTTS